MKIIIDNRKCTGSGECVRACPHDAIQIVNNRARVAYDRCDLDGLCIPACPHDAIRYSEDNEEPGT